MPFTHLSELPQEQKAVRIRGLLIRLFGTDKFIVSAGDSAAELSGNEQEKTADLFEKALINYYGLERKGSCPKIENLFDNTENIEKKAKFIWNLLQKAVERITDVQALENGFTAIEKSFNAKEDKQLKAMNKIPADSHPDLLLLANINKQAIPTIMSITEFIAKSLLKYFNMDLVKEIIVLLNFKKYVYDDEFLLIFFQTTKQENPLQKHYETMFLKFGLFPPEYIPIINEIIKLLADMTKKENYFFNILTFNKNASDKPYLALQYKDLLLKGMETPCKYIFFETINRAVPLFFYKAAFEKAVLQYEIDKNRLTQDQLLIIFLVRLQTVDYFIRWHRPEFDTLCLSKGLKESLKIQDMIERNPEITLEALRALAKIPPPTLLSEQARTSTGSTQGSSSAITPRNTPFNTSEHDDDVNGNVNNNASSAGSGSRPRTNSWVLIFKQ